ncbi:26647_t:CDS:2, partial [Dentiscutata erythropus]
LSEKESNNSIIELDLMPIACHKNKVYCKCLLYAEKGYAGAWKNFSNCNRASTNFLSFEDSKNNYSNHSEYEDFFNCNNSLNDFLDSEISNNSYSDYSQNDKKIL